MQMPPTPDQRPFYRALLAVIGAPQTPSMTLAILDQVARASLLRMAPRKLSLDEAHHLAGREPSRRPAIRQSDIMIVTDGQHGERRWYPLRRAQK
jgi:hypothetical protein